MRIACWSWGGRDHVGTVSADGQKLTQRACDDPSRGTLPPIELLDRGGAPPSAQTARRSLKTRQLLNAAAFRAPLPRPRPGLYWARSKDKPRARVDERPMVFTPFAVENRAR